MKIKGNLEVQGDIWKQFGNTKWEDRATVFQSDSLPILGTKAGLQGYPPVALEAFFFRSLTTHKKLKDMAIHPRVKKGGLWEAPPKNKMPPPP